MFGQHNDFAFQVFANRITTFFSVTNHKQPLLFNDLGFVSEQRNTIILQQWHLHITLHRPENIQ